MTQPERFTLIDPKTGNLAFQIRTIEKDSLNQVQRLNQYSLIWIKKGKGHVNADFSEYAYNEGAMFCFSPHQPFMLTSVTDLEALVIHFHPDFFCIYKHQKEVACDGVLFNNIYTSPQLTITERDRLKLDLLIDQMKDEMQQQGLAQYELLVSYLKIFLITASRLKTQQQESQLQHISNEKEEPFVLQKLKDFINLHYKTKHKASEYAEMLTMSQKALAKLTKTYFNKTMTDLITDRIVIEAKRELYLTNKTVKEIAYDLGYDDEYYFSRFFKKKAALSPQAYRDSVGVAKPLYT
ncbi:helix-turn-helix domain-containing protein [Neptunitalea lumnitzerae]|uniref:Transcriptional regulator n=1 Tax=Neptunitalea lumnitzerae TaxID=2965509 RepID=A0ABQ5MMY9_9FLAO|nr:helix-turn-helix domain-containing protein [Neptunitalea sp. Y10]GLB50337.1 transcriptional regulator [Neptunitalea sp. Y10]